MRRLRRVSFLALCALALVGCGTAEAINQHPFIAATASASPSATPTPACPTDGSAAPADTFCLTPAETSAGETAYHMPTIPDSVFIGYNESLTTAPSDVSTISPAAASQSATAYGLQRDPTAKLNSIALVQVHSALGQPADGNLCWVADMSPPGGIPEDGWTAQYLIIFVSASTGSVIAELEAG